MSVFENIIIVLVYRNDRINLSTEVTERITPNSGNHIIVIIVLPRSIVQSM